MGDAADVFAALDGVDPRAHGYGYEKRETTCGAGARSRNPLVPPTSGYAVTTESRGGISYRRISRPAENDWEAAKFGSSEDATNMTA